MTENEKFDEANKIRDEKKKEHEDLLAEINDPKKADALFRKKLSDFAKPSINVFLGTISAFLSGILAPCFGFLIVKNLFAMLSN